MADIRVAVIGDREGIDIANRAMKYPQLIGASYIYNDEMIRNVGSDFLDGWDIIVTAFSNINLGISIENIIKQYRAGSAVILDFFKLRQVSRPMIAADTAMTNPYYDCYEGIIMGLSHAEMGILPDRLGLGNVANLAVSSQDLYYNYVTLEYCYTKYYEKIKNIKSAVIDMYDYSYFNFDSSKSAKIMNFIGCGGYNKDKHNFDENKEYKGTEFERLVSAVEDYWKLGYDDEALEIWSMLFDTDMSKLFENRYMNVNNISQRVSIVSDEQIEKFTLGRYTQQLFEKTIAENKECFVKIMELLYRINPDIQIYLTLLPRYEGVWQKEEILFSKWKEKFYEIIDGYKAKYKYEMFDYTRNDIGKHRESYFDDSHFNFFGAMKFTDMLKGDIAKCI
ncbi:hypothetical protein [Butyrivibrio sp. AE2015]|uniref:hypothetical protein n=1 Tax=Butyrivibrio sp. AE2015 TaxID=1280663 RepID=UPI0003B5A1EF|nr:hypothetical protein [Butyrivibrio sp. AE2015]